MTQDAYGHAARRIWGNGGGRVPWQLGALRVAFRWLGPLAPALAARRAYRLWFRTQRFLEPRRERALLEQAAPVALDYEGVPVAAFAWGEGPTVVLVHGWNGRGAQLGAFVEPLVAAGLRVVAFDAPAHGRTPGQATDIFEMGAIIQRLTEREGPVAGAIAHSLGTLAVVVALGAGAPIARVVSLSPPGGLDALVEKFAAMLALPDSVVRRLQGRLEAFIGADFWQRVDSPDAPPALVIHDRDDTQIPWREAEAVAARWPDARLELTSGLGHRRLLRDRRVVSQVVAFLTAEST